MIILYNIVMILIMNKLLEYNWIEIEIFKIS